MSISESLLPEYDEEMANTRKLLERTPEDKLDYKPHPKSMALGQLAGHIADIPMWGKMTMDTEVLNLDNSFKSFQPTSRQNLIETFDKAVAETREAFQKATDQDWQVVWTMNWNGQQIMSLPRIAVIRSMIMNHLIHHRAQLGVFLRLNNVEIPGMYGPSADDMAAFAAQT